MPRRNRPARTKPRSFYRPAEKPPTLDAVARSLVRQGKASVAILGPMRFGWTTEAGGASDEQRED